MFVIPFVQIPTPLRQGQSKYDPMPAALSASPKPLDAQADPLHSLLKASLRPHQHSKYDPLSVQSELEGEGQSSSPVHVSVPKGASKYDPLPGLLSADSATTSDDRLDLLRGILKAELPSGDSKYDPLHSLLASDAQQLPEGRLDLLRGLLKSELPSGDSKYDPLHSLLSSDAQQLPEGRLDLLRGLLKAELPSGDSKYNPLQSLLSSDAQQLPEGRLDLLRGLLKTELPAGDSKYDPLPEVLSSDTHHASGERLDLLRALLRAELPTGDSKYDPLPHVMAAQPKQKQHIVQNLPNPRVPAVSSKFDPLKEILRSLRERPDRTSEVGHSSPDPSHSANAPPSSSNETGRVSSEEGPFFGNRSAAAASGSREGKLGGDPFQEGASALGEALSSANQRQAAASHPGVFDPSFVRAMKGQFSESQSPDTGFAMDARDPRLSADQKSNLISQQPPTARPFAAGSGPGWLEEASTSLGSSEDSPAVADPNAAVAKTDAASVPAKKAKGRGLQVHAFL